MVALGHLPVVEAGASAFGLRGRAAAIGALAVRHRRLAGPTFGGTRRLRGLRDGRVGEAGRRCIRVSGNGRGRPVGLRGRLRTGGWRRGGLLGLDLPLMDRDLRNKGRGQGSSRRPPHAPLPCPSRNTCSLRGYHQHMHTRTRARAHACTHTHTHTHTRARTHTHARADDAKRPNPGTAKATRTGRQ